MNDFYIARYELVYIQRLSRRDYELLTSEMPETSFVNLTKVELGYDAQCRIFFH
jgi:hypothetical protein